MCIVPTVISSARRFKKAVRAVRTGRPEITPDRVCRGRRHAPALRAKPLAVREVAPDNSEAMEREPTYRRGVPDDDDARARIISEALPLLSMTTSALREWEGQIRREP